MNVGLQVRRFVRPGQVADNQAVVGVSISLDKLVHAALEDKSFASDADDLVLVCSRGKKSLEKDALALIKELWARDIIAQMWQPSSAVGKK